MRAHVYTVIFDDEAMRRDIERYLWWQQNITIAELERRCGVSRGMLYRWMQGRHRPSLDLAATVASVCDLDLNRYVVTRAEEATA